MVRPQVGDKWGSRVDCAHVEVLAVTQLTVRYRWSDSGVTSERATDEFVAVFDPPKGSTILSHTPESLLRAHALIFNADGSRKEPAK